MADGPSHVSENMEVSIPESMMKKCLSSLKGSRGTPDNMNYGDMFAVRTRDTIDSGKLSDTWIQLPRYIWAYLTKCCDKSTQPFHSSVTVGRICSIQFITFGQSRGNRSNVQLPTQVKPSTSSMKSIKLEKESTILEVDLKVQGLRDTSQSIYFGG